MRIVQLPQEMQREVNGWRRRGLSVGLVPTMGCLHQGHLSLVRKARELSDRVIVSIFVNPMQFGPDEDLGAYPRQFTTDCNLAENEGATAVFAPADQQMYSAGFQTMVRVKKLSLGMCGADRPGHFDGVATVVSKLFNITTPNIAVFGEKDYQQLVIIRQLTQDLNFPVKIIAAPIVRESDGLAMSSRNKYLTGTRRNTALCLFQAVSRAKKLVADTAGSVDPSIILEEVGRVINGAGAELEYAVIVDTETLAEQSEINDRSRIVLAAKIDNSVRLIDNAMLTDWHPAKRREKKELGNKQLIADAER